MDPKHGIDRQNSSELTRREMLGYGLVAGGAAVVLGNLVGGGTTAWATGDGGVPEALGAALPGLTYLGIDAYAFWPDVAAQRVYSHATGSQPVNPNTRIWAPLAIPAGSVVMQISASYQGQPILEISRRPLYESGTALAPANIFQQTLPSGGGGPTAVTINLPPTPITIDRNATYTVSAYCSAGASILGVSVGYLTGFVPFTGSMPRVLDTRNAGQGPALAPATPRTVPLGLPGRVAVFNLTATSTTGPGYIAAHQAGIAWPNNSSVNFTGPGQTVANFAMCAMDANGQIAIRSEVSSAHVIVDLVGSIM